MLLLRKRLLERLLLLLKELPFWGRVSGEEGGRKAGELGNPLRLVYDFAPCMEGSLDHHFLGVNLVWGEGISRDVLVSFDKGRLLGDGLLLLGGELADLLLLVDAVAPTWGS